MTGAAVLYLRGFSVITGGLGAEIFGGCAVAHLPCHFQTKHSLSTQIPRIAHRGTPLILSLFGALGRAS